MGRVFIAFGICVSLTAVANCAAEGLPKGIWSSPNYGYVFAVDTKSAQIYDVSVAGCVAADVLPAEAATALWGEAEVSLDGGEATLVRAATRDFVSKLAALPAICMTPLKTSNPAVNLEVFLETLGAHYPFFKERNADWPALMSAARQRQAAGQDLFDVIATIIRALDDGHVELDAGTRKFEIDRVIAPGRASDGADWTWKSLRTSLRAHLQGDQTFLLAPAAIVANNRVMAGRTSDGYGYVAVLAMGGWAEGQTEETAAKEHTQAAEKELDDIVRSLGPVKGYIVDLRVNSGGFDSVALALAGRFAANPKVAYLKTVKGPHGPAPRYPVSITPSEGLRFTGPVAVLIGPNTVSAGETAAAAFKSLPNAKLFGMPTRGILSDAIPKRLPNGWSYTLSMEIMTLPDGTPLEVNGVKPDKVLAPGPKLDWDIEFEAARTWLKMRQ